MLDDLKMIHERDTEDALGVAEKQWQQLGYEFELAESFKPQSVKNIVYAGMGGSALSAQLAKTWLDLDVPLEVVRDYQLPAYAGNETLCVVASYSGNTEEELYILEQAEQRGCAIVIIASGGKLVELAHDKGYPLLQVPTGFQPRYTVWYILKAIAVILERCGLVEGKVAEIEAQAEWFKGQLAAWVPTVTATQNPAKQLALEMAGKSVVIYSGPQFFPAAYKWKISFNENAKQIAWCDFFPEFNHNEFLGWTEQPVNKPYAVIDLRSNLDHDRVQKRFEVSERLLSGMRPAPHIVQLQGTTVLQQMMWAIGLGDFVTIYTALLSGINPTPVVLIEKFKHALND